MTNFKRCTVELEDGTQCKRLASKSIEHNRICTKHYRQFKNELTVKYWLGTTEAEARANVAKVLKEDGLI